VCSTAHWIDAYSCGDIVAECVKDTEMA